MAVTQKQLAQHLGISRSLVGLALNDNPMVASETRRRVLESAREQGYRPHSAARSLRSGKTYAAALVWCPPEAPDTSTLALRLSGAGYELRLKPYSTPAEALAGLRDVVQECACDVFILWDSQHAMVRERGELLESLGVPFVIMGRFEESHPQWCQIDFDHEAMMARAVHELANRGHRRIFYIGFDTRAKFAEKLRAGYLAGMRERFGAQTPGKWLAAVDAGAQVAENALRDWLALPINERPTAAVVGAGSYAWLGLEKALAKLGRRIGYDDGDFAVMGIADQSRPLIFGHALAYQTVEHSTLAEAVAQAAIALADKRPPVAVRRIMPELTEMWCSDMPLASGGGDAADAPGCVQ